MEEGSTFGFPPSIHGAVGALSDVAVLDWQVDRGGAFEHGGGTAQRKTKKAKRNSFQRSPIL